MNSELEKIKNEHFMFHIFDVRIKIKINKLRHFAKKWLFVVNSAFSRSKFVFKLIKVARYDGLSVSFQY